MHDLHNLNKQLSGCHFLIRFLKKFYVPFLTISVPIPKKGRKITQIFIFHFFVRLKRIYEGL